MTKKLFYGPFYASVFKLFVSLFKCFLREKIKILLVKSKCFICGKVNFYLWKIILLFVKIFSFVKKLTRLSRIRIRVTVLQRWAAWIRSRIMFRMNPPHWRIYPLYWLQSVENVKKGAPDCHRQIVMCLSVQSGHTIPVSSRKIYTEYRI